MVFLNQFLLPLREFFTALELPTNKFPNKWFSSTHQGDKRRRSQHSVHMGAAGRHLPSWHPAWHTLSRRWRSLPDGTEQSWSRSTTWHKNHLHQYLFHTLPSHAALPESSAPHASEVCAQLPTHVQHMRPTNPGPGTTVSHSQPACSTWTLKNYWSPTSGRARPVIPTYGETVKSEI